MVVLPHLLDGLQLVTKVSDIVIGGHVEQQFAQDHTTTTGLTFGYKSGLYTEGTVVTEVDAGTVTLTDASVNVVYLDTSLGTVAASTSEDTADVIALFQVTTSGGVITAVVDARARRTSVV